MKLGTRVNYAPRGTTSSTLGGDVIAFDEVTVVLSVPSLGRVVLVERSHVEKQNPWLLTTDLQGRYLYPDTGDPSHRNNVFYENKEDT